MYDKRGCWVNADLENSEYQFIKATYAVDFVNAFNEYIPEPETGTNNHKWYLKIRDMLEEYVMSVSDSYYNVANNIGNFYDARDSEGNSNAKNTLPYKIMESVESNIHFRQNYASRGQNSKIDSKGYENAYGWIKESIHRKTSDWKLGIFKRNVMPMSYILQFEDASEITVKIAKDAEITNDKAIQRRLPYEIKLMEINTKLNSFLSGGSKKFTLNDYIIGEVPGFYLKEASINNKISLLKVNYTKLGIVRDFTVKDINGKIFNITEKDFYSPRNFSKSTWINDMLIENSIMYFKNDLMIGQAGYFIPSSTPTKEDLDKIDWSIKADNKKQTLEKERAAKIGDKEKHTGSPYIKYKDVKIGDKVIRLQYVIVKQGEDKVGEQYNLYLVKHKVIEPKTLSTEERKTVNYYSYDEKSGKFTPNISNKNKQYDVNKLTQETVLSTGETSNKLVFEKGFYSASKQLPYGEVLNKHFNPIPGSNNLKGFTGYERLAKQPSEEVMLGGKVNEFGYGIWEALLEERNLYKKLDKYQKNKIKMFSKRHNIVIKQLTEDYKINEEIRKEEIIAINKPILERVNARINELIALKGKSNKNLTYKKKVQTELAELYKRKELLQKDLEGLSKEEYITNRKAIKQAMKDLERFGIKNNTWTEGEEGNEIVKSYLEETTSINENYASVGYIKQVREAAAMEEIDKIDIKIDKFEKKLDNPEIKSKDEIKKELSAIYKEKEHFETIFDYYRNNNNQDTLLRLTTTPHNLKHRVPFTDATKRDKSTNSEIRRLHSLFSRIERNELMLQTLEGLHDLSQFRNNKGHLPINQINKMMDVVRITLGDNTVKSDWFGVPTDYQTWANILNKIPGVSGWTIDGTERLMTQLRGMATQWYLRSSTGTPNRGQSYLSMILFGREINKEAREALYGDKKNIRGLSKEIWRKIIDYGGVRNATRAFLDATEAIGTKLGIRDGGSYIIPGVEWTMPNPFALTDYLSISWASREKFIESLPKGINSALMNFPSIKSKTYGRFTIESIIKRGLPKRTSEEQEQHLLRAQDALWKIYHLSKTDKTRENVNKILRNALIDYRDSMLRQWVNWTLSYYFDEDAQDLKYIKTFEGSEEYGHDISYVSRLIAADVLGDLGDVEGETRFMSDYAVYVGRCGMYFEQFKMTMPSLGKAFWNMGKGRMQFKNFGLFRTVFGHNIMKNFRMGSHGNVIMKNFDMTKRLIKATKILTSKESYNLAKEEQDLAAIQAARLFYTSSAGTLIPVILAEMKLGFVVTKYRSYVSGARGIESPMFAYIVRILTRYLVSYLLYANDDDDDDEKRKKKALKYTINDLARLIIAPWMNIPFGMNIPFQWMLDRYYDAKEREENR